MTEEAMALLHQWENTLIVLVIRYGRACRDDDGAMADETFKALLQHLRGNPARGATNDANFRIVK